MQREKTPTHTKVLPPSLQKPVTESPPLGPLQKQVQFNLADDLGRSPLLPMDLANFLGGNTTNEWNDAPHPTALLTVGSSQVSGNNNHQSSPTHTGEAQPKNTAKPMATV